MDRWDSNPPNPQPGQNTLSDSRSQPPTARHQSGTPPALYPPRSSSHDTPPSLESQPAYSIYPPLGGAVELGRKPATSEPGYFGGIPTIPTTQADMVSAPPGVFPHMSVAPPGSVTTYPPRRKAIRAAQACDACRARKAKCDEGRPQCGFCKETGANCVYREVPPPKQDRTLLQILDRLGRVESLLDNMNSREKQQHQSHQPFQALSTAGPSDTPQTTTSSIGPLHTPSIQQEKAVDSHLEGDEGLAIPYEHTTAAQKLMVIWPSIRRLLDEEIVADETYVMDSEEARGFLRIHGRGEGAGTNDAVFEDDSDDETTDAMSYWGEASPHPSEDFGGPQDASSLKLVRQTIFTLLNSYLSNIHILHPILDTATITYLVGKFADRFNPPAPMEAPVSAWMQDANRESATPSPRLTRMNSYSGKRKRSESVTSSRAGPKVPKIQRTIQSALVLFVLSLGSITAHRTPVPGAVPRASSYAHSGIYPAPQQPLGQPPRYMPRNMDVIPGLQYFAKGLDIMGGLMGKNKLEAVQAGLLAGLYWSQMGRVLDSWKWINWASMGCQILVRQRLEKETDEFTKDMILRAYWSCLQLESDILAELDLPPSGISRLEDTLPLPLGLSKPVTSTEVSPDNPLIWLYYLAQIALRKLLNRVHTALYKQSQSKTRRLDSPRSLIMARELDYQLEQWRKHLPGPLQWSDDEGPSPDINAARLRAKYFGARYIIHRPFVFHALHSGTEKLVAAAGSSPGSVGTAGETSYMSGEEQPVSPEMFTYPYPQKPVDPNSLEVNCRKCIEAAICSTTAFHAFDPDVNRPIITNVFGTGHA
ncbi:hypothetical protein EX30DRAFT_348572 [Ascodesmis nigricans]|uniref:Zn(2)-C6 fungal-type domain-containing protein n=1 Tax=Ascodesmis nigricans TaxID=341454 RepID=A0A4S2MXQ6_9PEZI|nr:hypothetical protein EX30DRAFT_348572 [Ascodesmis nigricans]